VTPKANTEPGQTTCAAANRRRRLRQDRTRIVRRGKSSNIASRINDEIKKGRTPEPPVPTESERGAPVRF
jgi:hypothetical protein